MPPLHVDGTVCHCGEPTPLPCNTNDTFWFDASVVFVSLKMFECTYVCMFTCLNQLDGAEQSFRVLAWIAFTLNSIETDALDHLVTIVTLAHPQRVCMLC